MESLNKIPTTTRLGVAKYVRNSEAENGVQLYSSNHQQNAN